MKVSTRGATASRALLSLALHGDGRTPTSVREIATVRGSPSPISSRFSSRSKVLAWCDPSAAWVAATCWPAPPTRSVEPDRRGRRADLAGDFGEPHQTAPATTKASACCWPSGPRPERTCAITWAPTPWPTSRRSAAATTTGPTSRQTSPAERVLAEGRQHRREIGRQGRGEGTILAGHRMDEAQF